MKAHEKYMLLDLMRSTALNRGIRVIRVEEFYNKYCKALHVTKRVIQMYLCTLRKYFAVRIKEGKYYIKFLGGKLFEKPKRSAQGKRTTYIIDNTAADQQREYVGRVLLRREQMGRDVIEVFSAVLHSQAEESILFDIKYFHKMLRHALKLDK